MKFTKIPTDTFQKLQLNAGVLASSFTINPSTGKGSLTNDAIIGATSGGITITAIPTFKDFGEDVDNCPKNTKEMKQVVAWDIKASGTFVTANSAMSLLGSSDYVVYSATKTTDSEIVTGKAYYLRSGSGTSADPYTYTRVLYPSAENLENYYDNPVFKYTPVQGQVAGGMVDFMNHLWFVGDFSDVNDGSDAGYMACHLKDVLSTGGFSMTTQDMEKGKFAFEYTAHYKMATPEDVPFEIYVHAGT